VNFNTAFSTFIHLLFINHGVMHNPQPVQKTDMSTTYNKLKLIENYKKNDSKLKDDQYANMISSVRL